jgi:hypothetical protein
MRLAAAVGAGEGAAGETEQRDMAVLLWLAGEPVVANRTTGRPGFSTFLGQMALASLVAISGPKKSRITRPTPPSSPRNGFSPIKIITSGKCCGNVTICTVPVQTFEKLRFQFRFRLLTTYGTVPVPVPALYLDLKKQIFHNNFGKNLAFYIVSLVTRKFISFIKFIVKCE